MVEEVAHILSCARPVLYLPSSLLACGLSPGNLRFESPGSPLGHLAGFPVRPAHPVEPLLTAGKGSDKPGFVVGDVTLAAKQLPTTARAVFLVAAEVMKTTGLDVAVWAAVFAQVAEAPLIAQSLYVACPAVTDSNFRITLTARGCRHFLVAEAAYSHSDNLRRDWDRDYCSHSGHRSQ